MSAMTERHDFAGWGDVPFDLREGAYLAKGDPVVYWIYSYDTPIAWRYADGRWHMPPVRYSQTTSGHQRRTAATIGYDFEVETSLMVGNGHSGRYGARKGW